ncbi:MAG: DNA primase [Bacteroidia bacterium]
MRLPRSFIEEVLRHADIVEVVSGYLPLKKKGANYWALSPFKPEKTPSFAVSPSKQIYKCFSSGKGGDVIRFVMEMEGLSYPEAVLFLAQKYGIPIPELRDSSEVAEKEERVRQRLLAVHKWAAQLYQEVLRQAPKAWEYLIKRGLKPETIELFQLGYAPATWDFLQKNAPKAGFKTEELFQAGLLAGEHNGYDRFRDRIMFPLRDGAGRIIAFAGRALHPDENTPKYLNSPETLLYRKSEVLYGFFEGKVSFRQVRWVLVVEGYMDVIALHQAGIKNVVAPCGTALTESHIQLLKRYVDKVVIAYDGDEAGQKASENAIEAVLRMGLMPHVLVLPPQNDPDEHLAQIGKEAFVQKAEAAPNWIDFFLQRYDIRKPEKHAYVTERIAQGIAWVPKPTLAYSYLTYASEKLGVPKTLLENFSQPPLEVLPVDREDSPPPLEKELLRLWLQHGQLVVTHPETHMPASVESILREYLSDSSFTHPLTERLRQGLSAGRSPQEILWEDSSELQALVSELLIEKYPLSSQWQKWEDKPIEENVTHSLYAALGHFQVRRLSSLLNQMAQELQCLPPDSPSYGEMLNTYQYYLQMRKSLAQQLGITLSRPS